jgi:hypothetical protein
VGWIFVGFVRAGEFTAVHVVLFRVNPTLDGNYAFTADKIMTYS